MKAVSYRRSWALTDLMSDRLLGSFLGNYDKYNPLLARFRRGKIMYNRLNTALLASSYTIYIICMRLSPGTLAPLAKLYWVFIAVLIILGIGLIALLVIFLMNLSKLLKSCGEHAAMSPNLVWLNLVPIVNAGWMIYTVIKVSESIEKSFRANGSQDPGKGAR